MIAVTVPAHNEQSCIAACLQNLQIAARCPRLKGEPVLLIVALDACTDSTELVARFVGASTVVVHAHNVGIARAAGAQFALAAGARWLAFTDADSVVAPDWLSAQLAQRSDAVCGTITVLDWGTYGTGIRHDFDRTYTNAENHRNVHGANFGVSANAYRRVGGFLPLRSGEDVALVDALMCSGASVAWTAAPRVTTSSRRSFRAPDGFGATLARAEREGLDRSARQGA